MEVLERSCLQCGRSLKGRVDKKFCDDYCRNAFNNKQNSDPNNLVRNINAILRKNRRLLDQAIPQGEGKARSSRARLAGQGFQFKYHTHQYTNKKGDVYHFCYDLGYLPLDGDWLLVVKRNQEETKT